jgi:hypothetical protein
VHHTNLNARSSIVINGLINGEKPCLKGAPLFLKAALSILILKTLVLQGRKKSECKTKI